VVTGRAPGKLFIAGEYAVVDPGNPAILLAVDRYLTVRAERRSGPGRVFSSAYPAPREWRRRGHGAAFADGSTDYLTAAIGAVEELRETRGLPPASYDLHIASELTAGEGRKLGLGSSGAVVVATIDALARLYDLPLTLTERFRLAVCAIIQISPRGSGGDVAASTYGGWIRYTSPDRERVASAASEAGVAAAIAADDVWAGCEVTPIAPPVLPLFVGWTASPADTDALVAASTGEPAHYPTFHTESAAAVENIRTASTPAELLDAVTDARRVLMRFAAARGVLIETPALTALCDAAERHGGAGKTSGAGGGDCGIAFAPADAATQILKEWEEQRIIPLDLAPHRREGDARD